MSRRDDVADPRPLTPPDDRDPVAIIVGEICRLIPRPCCEHGVASALPDLPDWFGELARIHWGAATEQVLADLPAWCRGCALAVVRVELSDDPDFLDALDGGRAELEAEVERLRALVKRAARGEDVCAAALVALRRPAGGGR